MPRRHIMVVVADEDLENKEVDVMDPYGPLVAVGIGPVEKLYEVRMVDVWRGREVGATNFLLEHDSYDELARLQAAPIKEHDDPGIVPK